MPSSGQRRHCQENSAARLPVPFLKWAGGKSQLLSTFDQYLPTDFNCYFEPFVGGGAMFFHLAGRGLIGKAKLSDLNEELVNAYMMVRDYPDRLIARLAKHRNDEDYFYKLRALDTKTLDNLERASRLIYLNKTCFNGLYRVNRQGQFNVPFGYYKNPRTCDVDNLQATSNALATTKLHCGQFEATLATARRGDFVYLDPPYQPISSTANFTSYTSSCFASADQERLAQMVRKLDRKGCRIMLSNSDNDFIRTLYRDFRIETVYATRAINCRGDRRGKITEVLVLNY